MSVNKWDEPNVSIGEKPILMESNITVFGTVKGEKYSIFRYDSLRNVPNSDDFVNSNYDYVYNFTAESESY